MVAQGLNLEQMIQVFRKYMKEIGGMSEIQIEMETTEFSDIIRTIAVVQISDIPNLDTRKFPSGTCICMHDYWGPSGQTEFPPYDGQADLKPPSIDILNDANTSVMSENPGRTPYDMYKKLRNMLPFISSISLINQLNRIIDRLDKLEHR
jgi:hypothetical protein